MSRLIFRSPETSPANVESPVATLRHHILLEATVRPIGTGDYNKEKVQVQAWSLKQLRNDGKDLFEMNETRKVQSAGTLLYQSTETKDTKNLQD